MTYEPCPFCGSAACLLQSKSFCRHTGKLRADTAPIIEEKTEREVELATTPGGTNHRKRGGK